MRGSFTGNHQRRHLRDEHAGESAAASGRTACPAEVRDGQRAQQAQLETRHDRKSALDFDDGAHAS